MKTRFAVYDSDGECQIKTNHISEVEEAVGMVYTDIDVQPLIYDNGICIFDGREKTEKECYELIERLN